MNELTITELVQRHDPKPNTSLVRKACLSGALPARHSGGVWLIEEGAYKRWLARYRPGKPGRRGK